MTELTHVHIKTGNKYKYLRTANENTSKKGWQEYAVYESSEGVWYTRPLAEFKEKFRKI